ncbi:hypothetical protein CRG98_034331 [Punica granatum]|uniref:Uncharacterized protein n=1 Tax=Punica granatum TaxID=22663 RepID=A0A2I0IMN7_PUNGR|nr:hypothetical protein CRG98_034331 [Punica granatum]
MSLGLDDLIFLMRRWTCGLHCGRRRNGDGELVWWSYSRSSTRRGMVDFDKLNTSQEEDEEGPSGLAKLDLRTKAVGGSNKKGQMYGLKHLNLFDIPGSSHFMERDAERMRTHTSLLDAKIRANVQEEIANVRAV